MLLRVCTTQPIFAFTPPYFHHVGQNCESSSAACSAAAAAAAAPARQVWIGVLLDEPRGKNNGTAKGKEYFKAGKNYGLFLKPHNVKVESEGARGIWPRACVLACFQFVFLQLAFVSSRHGVN